MRQLLVGLKRVMIRTIRRIAEFMGYDIYPAFDYSSPLPTESKLRKNIHRWNRPSSMAEIKYDIDAFKGLLKSLMKRYLDDFKKLPDYSRNKLIGFGHGYTELDALLLYMMIRDLKPSRYLEVGSGLSTYYCSLAAKENARIGRPVEIKCIEPHPFSMLSSITGIQIIQDEVQNVKVDLFSELEENDILFIDSSHILKIDGDIPFLYLEILPVLKKGVIVHIHDVPFPYNIPYPPEQWVFGKSYWPAYWNEAMILQAFLAFNNSFEIMMSMPLIRYHDEQFLKDSIPLYKSIKDEPNTFSSIWLRRVI